MRLHLVGLALGLCAWAALSAPSAQAQWANGEALAAELGCGACHAGVPGSEQIQARAPDLGDGATPLSADFVFLYLADPVRRRDDIGAARMPDFGLDERERLALALFLGTDADAGEVATARRNHPDVGPALGERIFGRLGCGGCHGASGGDLARSGPDLSREGARVRPDWLRGYLAAPSAIRSPAHPAAPGARMPDFRLTVEEAEALTAYLSSLGEPRVDEPPRLTAFEERRTRRLLEDRVACLGCHRIDGVGGGIGPGLEGIADRLRPEFVVEVILDPAAAHPAASMPRQRMPPREAGRLARLLLDAGGTWRGGAPRSLADPGHPAWTMADGAQDATEGARLYAQHCAACHGNAGGGDGWNAAALPVIPTVHADPVAMGRRPDDTLYDGIAAGAFVLDGSPRMPPFGDLLSDGQIRALVAYIRVLCGCEQPAWAREAGR